MADPATRIEPTTGGLRRIAALLAAADDSGRGRQLVTLATELRRRGIELELLLLARDDGTTPLAELAAERGVACRVIRDRVLVDPIAIAELRRHLLERPPDILQTHGCKPTWIALALRRMGLRLPWIGYFEGAAGAGLGGRLATQIDLLLLRAADTIVVMSEAARRRFPARRKVEIVYCCVSDTARSAPGEPPHEVLRRRRGAAPGPLIGVIGPLRRDSGVDTFLEALALLRARDVPAQAAIIGDGPELSQLRLKAHDLGLDGRAHFLGRLESQPQVYAALDMLVIPARSEMLHGVLMEAMQADLPVVATRVGAMVEIAATYPGALELVAPASPRELADAMAGALAEPGAPAPAAARAQLVAECSASACADHMVALYGQVLHDRGQR